MQKVQDSGNLDARKFLRNQVLAENFGAFLHTFLRPNKSVVKSKRSREQSSNHVQVRISKLEIN